MTHATVRRLLYDYVQGLLPPQEHAAVEDHLRSCARCSDHGRRMRDALDLLGDTSRHPSDERPREYWDAFARSVEDRLRDVAPHSAPLRFAASLEDLFLSRRPVLAGAGALLVVAVALSFFLRPGGNPAPPSLHRPDSTLSSLGDSAGVGGSVRLASYLRRSKALLVGLEHLTPGDETPPDYAAERRASLELVREAHELRTAPLDPRSAHLIEELAQIQTELAAIQESAGRDHIEVIRTGARERNLLFKVRMAEVRLVGASPEGVR